MEKYKKSWDFHGRTLTVENGEMAKQAGGSVLVRYGDTVVLSAATAPATMDLPIGEVDRQQEPYQVV